MRHSDEENLAQVFTSRQHELSDQLYWYDGLESVVRPGESVSETRHFSGSHELDYQEFSVVESAYEQRRDTGPPDKTEVLHNEARAYSTPYGFLTCLREVSRQISSQFENHREGFLREHYSGTYAYNAKTYVLEVIRLRYHSTFSVVDKGGNDTAGLSGLQFSDVAEAQFQLRNQADGSKHDFCLWFPLRGNLQGVPLRILDKPRWWLQVDLRLVNQ
jgi:hypothetical protein